MGFSFSGSAFLGGMVAHVAWVAARTRTKNARESVCWRRDCERDVSDEARCASLCEPRRGAAMICNTPTPGKLAASTGGF